MATEITIKLPDRLYLEAKQIAESKKEEIEDVIVQSINFQNNESKDQKSQMEMVISKEQEAFEKLHPELIETHLGSYVAISGGNLIDSDEDKRILYQRVYQKFPHRHIFIKQVEDIPIGEINFRSPKIER